MNKLGHGIAIAGIWIGVAIASFNIGVATVPLGICAAGATFFVALLM